MNLFILDIDPVLSAQYHTDKHIVKMPTETAQMISFVYHDKNYWNKEIPEFVMGFSKTHYKHPCSIWIRESISNFLYACRLGLELYREYQYRYENPEGHKRTKAIFDFAIENPPNLPNIGTTPFALAMDEKFIKFSCPVENYREYYRAGKNHLFSWKKRQVPVFLLPF